MSLEEIMSAMLDKMPHKDSPFRAGYILALDELNDLIDRTERSRAKENA